MNYYKITQKTFINNELVPCSFNREVYSFDDYRFTCGYTLDSWDDIEDFYTRHCFNAYLKKCRKGYKLYVKGRRTLKSWKDTLHIEIVETAEMVTPTMQQLLYCHDADKAIKYMTERGLQVLPHGKR